MKKLTPLLLFFLTFQAYGLSLDDMISEIQNRGYSKEFRQFEEDRLEIEGTKIDLINRDGIDLEAQSDYLEDESREFDSTLSAKYDLFKYSAEYNHENGDTEKELIGIEKELKDIFFSERKYKSTVFSYDKKYRLNLQEEKIEEEVISLISLYKEYMDTKLELELKEKLRPGLVNDMKKLQKELELGSGTEFDYKYSQMLVDNSSADIKQLMDDLKKLKTDFYELYKIEVSGKDIENFKDIENLKKSSFQNIGERDVENSMFLLEKSRENYKYSKYDNKWPDITAGTFYDSVNDGWLISLGLNKKLFEYDDTSYIYEVEIQELELEKSRTSKETQNLKKDYENRYFSLLKEVENLKRENTMTEMKYEIYRLKYEQGSESYIDYIEKYDEYVENSIDLKKKNNELNALIYEIRYRR